MTRTAVRAKIPAMTIVLGMTGKTVGRRTLEEFILVALRTLHIDMRTCELEDGM